METRVQLDPATGAATITPAASLPPGKNLRITLFDPRANRYLTTSGWASGRKTLVEVTPDGNATDLVLEATTAAHVKPGTLLILEEIFVGIRESFTWPKLAEAPKPAPEPIPIETTPSSASSAEKAQTAFEPSNDPGHTDVTPARWRAVAIGAAAGMLLLISLFLIFPSFASIALPITLPPHVVVSSEAAVRTQADLDKLVARVSELETLLAKRETEVKELKLRVLTSPPPATAPSPSADLVDAQRLVNDLRKEVANQKTIITALTQDKFTYQVKVADLEARSSSGSESGIWGAASVNANGRIQTIINQPEENGARDIALQLCKATDAPGCRVVGTFSNMCLAVARKPREGVRPDNYGIGVAATANAAKLTAMANCFNSTQISCEPSFVTCSPYALSKQ